MEEDPAVDTVSINLLFSICFGTFGVEMLPCTKKKKLYERWLISYINETQYRYILLSLKPSPEIWSMLYIYIQYNVIKIDHNENNQFTVLLLYKNTEYDI